ncbi:DUF3862 domain-containing protein [Gottfriedia sp. OAE603]|uniref:DUF3862 domain-containing protein n=1 Tax=Gottfriedia sp. OAE603 TaxID=2663872 RepID=UPI00178B9B7B
MTKRLKLFIATVFTLTMFVGIAGNAEASTSQASYKLTAYNSKGKKVNVNAPKGLVVTWYKTGWYKGTYKYANYTKKNGKWVKGTKSATIFVQSSKVKKYTTTTNKWIKTTKEIKKAYLKVDPNNYSYCVGDDSGYGCDDIITVSKGSNVYKSKNNNDFLYAQDSKGKNIKVIINNNYDAYAEFVYNDPEKNSLNNDFDNDGIANVLDKDMDGDGIDNFGNYNYNGEYYDFEEDYDIDGNGIEDNEEYVAGYPSILSSPWVVVDAWVDTGDGGGYFDDSSVISYTDYDYKKVTTSTSKISESTQAYTKVYVPPAKNGITLAEFNKIKTGMTYQQVVQIIGENGTLDASSSGYGTTIKVYSWSQKNSTYGGSASILFENNKVQSKSQAGLK